MKIRRGRPSRRDEIKAINAAHRFMALLSPKPGAEAIAESYCRPVPAERAPRKPSGKPLEAAILKDIMQALRRHPKVATVERRQSAVFMEGNRYVRVGRRGEADISGILKGGRAFAIEVKRPGGKPNEKQLQFLERIRAAGGIAGCATSVTEAEAIIASAF